MESRRLERRLKERFIKAMATYRLIDDGDRILIGLSGGKDSLLLTELLAKRARIQHPRFEVEALHVRMENISYESDTSYLEHFCAELGVRLHIATTRFDVAYNAEAAPSASAPFTAALPQSAAALRRQKQPCFLCSWNRRKQLFNLAQQLDCNKIALGHHQDDIIHTALINLTFQGRFGTMPARLKIRKMPLSIIRPLCLIAETDIRAYATLRGYQQQKKLCPYENGSNRTYIRQLFADMERLNPEARYSIWRALNNSDKLTEE